MDEEELLLGIDFIDKTKKRPVVRQAFLHKTLSMLIERL